jgi:phosphopantetheinyl transferase (holo-ACP synthase)
LLNKAAERAQSLGARRVLISLTHSRATAGAVVILEG